MTTNNERLSLDIHGDKMKLWFAELVISIVDPIYWWANGIYEREMMKNYRPYQDSNLDQ